MSSKDAAAGDGGVVGSIESKSSIPVSKVYALAPERSVLSHEKGDFAYFFNWKKRHKEFEKNCESRGFKPGPLFDSLTEDAKNMVRWHTSDKYPDPLMEGAADEALILDWVNFWMKPPTSLKSNWKNLLRSKVKGIFNYKKDVRKEYVWRAACAKVRGAYIKLGLPAYVVKGQAVVCNKDLLLLMTENLPKKLQDGARTLVKRLVGSERLEEAYFCFEDAFDAIWSSRGGVFSGKDGEDEFEPPTRRPVRPSGNPHAGKVCRNCQKVGHIERNCRSKKVEPLVKPPVKHEDLPKKDLASVVCFNCRETGHYKNKCPHPEMPRLRSHIHAIDCERAHGMVRVTFGREEMGKDPVEICALFDTGSLTQTCITTGAIKRLGSKQLKHLRSWKGKAFTLGKQVVSIGEYFPKAALLFPNGIVYSVAGGLKIVKEEFPMVIVSEKAGREMGLTMPQDELFSGGFINTFNKLAGYEDAVGMWHGEIQSSEEKSIVDLSTVDLNGGIYTSLEKQRKERMSVPGHSSEPYLPKQPVLDGSQVDYAYCNAITSTEAKEPEKVSRMIPDSEVAEIVEMELDKNRAEYVQECRSDAKKLSVEKNALPHLDLKTGLLQMEPLEDQMKAAFDKLIEEGCPEKTAREIIQIVIDNPTVVDGNLSIASGLAHYPVALRKDAGPAPDHNSRKLPQAFLDWLKPYLDKLEESNIVTKIGGAEVGSMNEVFIEEVEGQLVQNGRSFSNLVMVKKSKEMEKLELRMCENLTNENGRQVKTSFHTPCVEELKALAAGAKSFFVLDLMQGYFQIELEESAKKHFCFVCPLGKYQLNRLPMGGLNSAAHLQSCMTDLLGDLARIGCYLDDVLGCATSDEEHVEKLREVFERFSKMNLKLQLKKLTLWTKKAVFIGHEFSEHGVAASSKKVQGLLDMEPPRTVGDLQGFCCTSTFLKPYIMHFSGVTRPMQNYLSDKLKSEPSRGRRRTALKRELIDWSAPLLKDSWDAFRVALVKNVRIAYLKPGYAIVTVSDASDYAWSSCVLQVPKHEVGKSIKDMEGSEILAVHSGVFSGSQLNWATIDKEAFAVVQNFNKSESLLRTGDDDVPVSVYTDHRNLLFLLTGVSGTGTTASKQASARLRRWALDLATFRFKIYHIAGEDNFFADFLSRAGQKVFYERQAESSLICNIFTNVEKDLAEDASQ